MKSIFVILFAAVAIAAADESHWKGINSNESFVQLQESDKFARVFADIFELFTQADDGNDDENILADDEDESDEIEDDEEYVIDLSGALDGDDEILKDIPENRGLIASSQARKQIRQMHKQMPCGFPEYGIPPLAPLHKDSSHFELKKAVFDSLSDVYRFRVDGLNDIKLKKFKVGLLAKKVKFDFTFRKIWTRIIRLDENFAIDLLKYLGFHIQWEGFGGVDFLLKNLRIKGSLKYKIPILIGSIKIYKFKVAVTLGGVQSNITLGNGIGAEGKYNRFFNQYIEDTIMETMAVKEKQINKAIAEFIVPRVNAQMKGHKIWFLIGKILGGSGSSNKKCVPPPDPWN